MRHLKDINMKKATLLLVMTCCTIGLGRVGASDGEGGDGGGTPVVEARKETEDANVDGVNKEVEKAVARSNTEQAISGLVEAVNFNEYNSRLLRGALLRIMGGYTITNTSYLNISDSLEGPVKTQWAKALEEYSKSLMKDYRRLIAMMLAMRTKLHAFTETVVGLSASNDRKVLILEDNNNRSYQLISTQTLDKKIMSYTAALLKIFNSTYHNLYTPCVVKWQSQNKDRIESDLKLNDQELSVLLGQVMSKIIQTYLVLKVIVSFNRDYQGTQSTDQENYMNKCRACISTVNNTLQHSGTSQLDRKALGEIPDHIINFIKELTEIAVSNPSTIIPLNLEKTLNDIHNGIMQGKITHNKESTAPTKKPKTPNPGSQVLHELGRGFGGVVKAITPGI